MTVRVGGLEFDDVSYDADGDVLYLSRGRPVAADETLPSSEGHAVRLDEAGEVIGITVVNARRLFVRDGQITVTIPETRDALQQLEASVDDLTAALLPVS